MGQDLFGKQVLNTYDAIIKVGDNDTLTGIAKQLSDGRGNDAPIWLSTARMGIGITPDTNYTLTVNGAAKIGSLDVTGAVTAASVKLTGGSGNQGLMSWNTDEETVDIIQNGATLQVGQEIQVHVKNQTGAAIADGTPVYVTGTVGSSGRLTVAPMIADGTIEAKYFLGITTEDIGDGEDGKVTTFGKIRGLNTSSYSEGDTLYVSASTAGAFQTTAPVAPNLDLEIAIVINSHVNNGTIFVRAQNGHYLGLLHDVHISSPANNQFLVYNSTNSRWENQGIASVGSINLDSVTDNGNTTTNNIEVGGITVGSPTFTASAGSINVESAIRVGSGANYLFISEGVINRAGTADVTIQENLVVTGDISAANMTLSGYLRGAANFVIDPAAYGDETGVVQILGDLRVDGTTTTINSTTVTIDDKNIVLANNAATAGDANGAGITVETGTNTPTITDATILYNSTNDTWGFNKWVTASKFVGNLEGDVTGDLTGNADTASALATARNIAVDGAVTGNADFDGSGDITITTSVNHNHDADYVNVTGDTMTGNLDFNDSVKARFGTGDDFTVYHSGLHAFLDNADGALFIRNFADDSDIILVSDDGNGGVDTYLRVDGSEGSVILYHYGDQKLETTATGVSVTGALSGNISTSSISGGTININGTTAINLQYNGTTQLRVDSTGVDYLGTVSFSNDGISLTDEDSTIDSFFHANVDYDAGTYTVTSNARYGADYIQVDGLDSRDDVKFTISPKDIGDPDPHAYLYIGGDNSITAPNTLVDWHTIEMNALLVKLNANLNLQTGGLLVGGVTVINSSRNITGNSFIKSGGTSSEFLKADGSVDSNTYLTTESDTLDSVADRGNSTNQELITSSYFTSTNKLALRDYATDAKIHLGNASGGASGVFAGRRLTDSGGLLYGTYWAYDAYWDDTSQEWTANRTTLGRKWKAEMGYHLNSFRISYFDGTVSSSWAQSDWTDLFSVDTVGDVVIVGSTTASSFIKSGGTSSQFLKADGSVDSNTYLTAEADTLGTVTNRGATTTNNITVGGLTATGNLYIGTVGQQNWIAFSGTTGDGGASTTYTTTYIGERIYGGTERSELILYKGNDGHSSTSGYDRIRMIGANLCFDTYNTAQTYPTDLDGVAALTTTRAMTIDTNQHVSINNGNLAVETGVIKIGTTTVIDASRVGYFTRINADSGTSGGLVVHNGGITASNNYMNFFTAQSSGWSFNANGTGADTDSVLRIAADGSIDSDGGITLDSTATFNSVAVFNGQVNYNSEDRSSYWSYDDKVAAVFNPAADDGAVAILFPSIGNSVSDFGYIAFDEDYGEAGVTAGENSVLLIGCENDGSSSSDHVRVKGRLVVEALNSSSQPTHAFQVKDGNKTNDLFRVARSGATVIASTLNVADQLTVDDAIRLTSNPTITGDSSGVYFWNQSGVGATIASNAFEVRTNGNTAAFSIDNSQVATIHNELRTNGNILVGGNSSLRHPALDRFVNVQSTTNGAIIGYNLAVIDGANNRRGSFFMDDSAGVYGIDHTYSSGSMDFVIRVAGGELMRVKSNGNVGIGRSPRTKLTVAGTDSEGGGVLTLENTTTATGAASYVGKINFYGNDSGTNANGIRASIVADIQGYNGETDLVFSTANANASQAEAMRIDQNQKVSIGGVVNPSATLDVKGVNNDAVIKVIRGNATSQYLELRGYGVRSYGNHALLTADDTKQVWLGHQTDESQVVVDTNGDVGIGTTSPNYNVHIATAGRSYLGISNQGSANGDRQLRLGFADGDSIARIQGTRQSVADDVDIVLQGGGGDVGIGRNPSYKLDVNGNLRVGTSSTVGELNFTTGSANYIHYSGGDCYFRVNGGKLYFEGSSGFKGAWENNGNLGISTTSPQAKLDVNGTVLLGREHGVTQLHNNKDWANMTSGLVWREYNATGTYAHATSSETLSDYIKSYNFTEQGIATTVDSFTRSDDTYAVEFVGYYYASINATYQFSVSSDDASDFFIDGTRVADWYGGHGDSNTPTGGTGQNAGTIYLVKGFHRLYARFQEGTGGDSLSLWHKINTGSWAKIPADRLYHKADDLFRATGSGNATLYGTFTATADIVAYSDERIKENVETIDNALNKVQQLRGVSFNRIKDGKHSIGVIAQEIEKVLPEVVTEDEQGIKAVAYGNVVGVLIEAIKEQQKQIDELKARLDA
jgi:hypothetical protein